MYHEMDMDDMMNQFQDVFTQMLMVLKVPMMYFILFNLIMCVLHTVCVNLKPCLVEGVIAVPIKWTCILK